MAIITSTKWTEYQDTITEIEISEGITEIADEAFGNAIRLEKIKIPSSVTKIGNKAFYRRMDIAEELGLTVSSFSVNMPKSVIELGTTICDRGNTINVEYNENEIPDTWDANWNSEGATVNYGVTMP